MTPETEPEMQMLDQLLSEAKEVPIRPSAGLMARIIADADREIDAALASAPLKNIAPRRGFFASLQDAVGGWPGIAGLTTATLAGVWIGFASPEALSDLSQSLFANQNSYDLGDFMPDLSGIFAES